MRVPRLSRYHPQLVYSFIRHARTCAGVGDGWLAAGVDLKRAPQRLFNLPDRPCSRP
jgi:hypothetical protein